MKYSKEKTIRRQKYNNLIIQLLLIVGIFIVLFFEGVLNNLFHALEALNLQNLDRVVMQNLFEFRVFCILSQLVSFSYINFKFLFLVFFTLIDLFFVISGVKKLKINKKQNVNHLKHITAIKYKAVYIVQQKFLC